MVKKKITNIKEIDKKVQDLKIEMLKQPIKKKSIKKEIARLLTSKNNQTKQGEHK
ncbi:MAG: ribosomal protein L29 [Patescibacteria group bacterium]|jgi:ribosomal protein L29